MVATGERHRRPSITSGIPSVMTGSTDVASNNKSIEKNALPQFPGEYVVTHSGTQWQEQAEARLAVRSLLAVAQGLLHIDVPRQC